MNIFATCNKRHHKEAFKKMNYEYFVNENYQTKEIRNNCCRSKKRYKSHPQANVRKLGGKVFFYLNTCCDFTASGDVNLKNARNSFLLHTVKLQNATKIFFYIWKAYF